jgi:hypothetical protein
MKTICRNRKCIAKFRQRFNAASDDIEAFLASWGGAGEDEIDTRVEAPHDSAHPGR